MRGFVALAIALSLFAAGNASATGDEAGSAKPSGSCTHLATPLPHELMGGAPASDGTYAYVIGGYSLGSNQTLDTVFRYDFPADSWTTLAPMPQSAFMASAVYYPPANKIYVFGCEDGVSGTNYAITRIYAVAANMWSTGTDMPDVRSFMVSTYDPLSGKIYLVAGYRTGQVTSAQSQVWAYDPVANTFHTSRAPIPHALGGAGSGLIAHHLYVAGGRDAANTTLNSTWDYHIGTNTWNVASPACANQRPGERLPLGKRVRLGRGEPVSRGSVDDGGRLPVRPVHQLVERRLFAERGAILHRGDIRREHGIRCGRVHAGLRAAVGHGAPWRAASSSASHRHRLHRLHHLRLHLRHQRRHRRHRRQRLLLHHLRLHLHHRNLRLHHHRKHRRRRIRQARLKIRRHHCSVGTVRRQQSSRVGRVLRQSPRVGVKRRNFPIDLVVGRR